MECNTCNGIGFVLVERPETVTKTFYKKDGYVCWPCDGGTPVRETFPTGRKLKINELCDDCHGSGKGLHPDHNPACVHCHGTGDMTVSDGHGCIDTDVCTCVAPAVELEVA